MSWPDMPAWRSAVTTASTFGIASHVSPGTISVIGIDRPASLPAHRQPHPVVPI
jgi:hypothetical protein